LVDVCKTCGSVWFDDRELYYVAYLAKLAIETSHVKLEEKIGYDCPRCKVIMQRLNDPMISRNVVIYVCPSCKGNWLKKNEISKFAEYREKRKRQMEKVSEDTS
jgi:Zn-finger nucleic acid-binding protein